MRREWDVWRLQNDKNQNMDQQKMQKLLRLLMLLSGNRKYSLAELTEKFKVSERTVYRYLETFEAAGFVLDRNDGKYRLQKDTASTRSLQTLMHFSEEEVLILYDTLVLIEGTSPVKEQLYFARGKTVNC